MNNEDELIEAAVKWTNRASTAVENAGGFAPGVLGLFPQDLLMLLVRNHIDLVYTGPG